MALKSVQDYKTINLQKNLFDIIGDIHGCYYELIELVTKLGYFKRKNVYIHPQGRRLISVGDIADKGYKNIDCINFWINQVNYGNGMWVYGNHCSKFYKYLTGNKIRVNNGIEKTISEYLKLPKSERMVFRQNFIKCYDGRSHYIMLDNKNLIVVHGCLKEADIGKFNRDIMLRCLYGDVDECKSDKFGKFLRNNWALEYRGKPFIVYGHTVVSEAKIINNTIDIDTGCVYGGHLTAFRYPERKIVQVKSKKAYVKYLGVENINCYI